MGGLLRMLMSVLVSGSLVVWATRYSENIPAQPTTTGFLQVNDPQIDSMLYMMKLEDKLDQLFFLVDDKDSLTTDTTLYDIIRQHAVGGVIFKGYTYTDQLSRTRKLQQLSALPLLIGMDESETFPPLMPNDLSWAAVEDDSLLLSLSSQYAHLTRLAGVHLRFLPLGEEILKNENYADLINKVSLLLRDMQQQRVLTCFTNINAWFPSEKDSVKLKEGLLPYQMLTQTGIPAFSIGPEVLSQIKFHFHPRELIRDYWSQQLAFNGLIFTSIEKDLTGKTLEDQMKKALTSGSEAFLVHPHQFSAARAVISQLLSRAYLLETDIHAKARQLMQAKSWAQKGELREDNPGNSEIAQQSETEPTYLDRRLVESSITLLKNDQNLIPFTLLRDKKIHLLSIGERPEQFLNQLRYYGPISDSHYRISENSPWKPLPLHFLKQFGPIIMAFSHELPDPARDSVFMASVEELREFTEVVVVNFGRPESLARLPETGQVIQAYSASPLAQEITAQVLFGGIPVHGILPVSIAGHYSYGMGEHTSRTRLAYTTPEAVGLNSATLSRIDSIVLEGLGSYAMPGCQVLVAKSGNIIYHKAFGHHTYTRKRKVWLTDLYDLASVTKIAATTLAAMDIYNKGKIKPGDKLAGFFKVQEFWTDSIQYLDTLFVGPGRKDSIPDSLFIVEKKIDSSFFSPPVFFKAALRTNIEQEVDTIDLAGDSIMVVTFARMGRIKKRATIIDKTLGELLTHTSGLQAGLPIRPFLNYKDSIVGKYDKYYVAVGDSTNRFKVAADFYLENQYWDSLWHASLLMRVGRKRYEYSDANMILVQQAIDSLNQEPLNVYLNRELYERLGIQNAGFNPREIYDIDRLVPTEYDARWRGQLLKGYVHDPTAALLGGVAGNAGLFSNANDLAIIFQMLLNGGTYGGEEYLRPETIRLFTEAHDGYRGYGFDKPSGKRADIIAPGASPNSYGHSGFTGTCVWVDPDEELIFIFLSNRIHPRADNWKLNRLAIRQRVHQVVYDAIAESNE